MKFTIYICDECKGLIANESIMSRETCLGTGLGINTQDFHAKCFEVVMKRSIDSINNELRLKRAGIK